MGRLCARLDEDRTTLKMLIGKYTRKRPLEGIGLDERTILEWTLNKLSLRGIGLIWLKTGIIGEPLRIWHWTSRFHKAWS